MGNPIKVLVKLRAAGHANKPALHFVSRGTIATVMEFMLEHDLFVGGHNTKYYLIVWIKI